LFLQLYNEWRAELVISPMPPSTGSGCICKVVCFI
jgi:hypothetical protein